MSQPTQYDYTLSWGAPNEHTYYVSLTTQPEAAAETAFHLPIWRPGRYLVQDFAAALSHFEAVGPDGRPLPWRKVDHSTWVVHHGARFRGKITVRYRWYANKIDAGSSYVGEFHEGMLAYFNPCNLFLYVAKRLDVPCQLSIPNLPADWKVATALRPTVQRNVFTAATYHDLADSPTMLGTGLRQFTFQEGGATFHAHFTSNYAIPAGQEQAWITDFQKLIREQAAIFGGLPLQEYHFLYLLAPFQIRHAVEHSYCAMFCLPEAVASSLEAFKGGAYGITSHEFWHLWNIKRIRPAALWPYDYSKTAYTSLHWFTEGVTDYYAYLTLTRAGLWSEAQFFDWLNRLITSLERDHGPTVVSPALSSHDCWLGTSSYQVPHHNVSFYSLGTRAGCLLDLHIRNQTRGQKSLDDVFRLLWADYYLRNQGVPEDGILRAANQLTGQDCSPFFRTYIEGPAPWDYANILTPAGLALSIDSSSSVATSALDMIGITRVTDVQGGGFAIAALLPGSDAFRAGLDVGDVLTQWGGQPLTKDLMASLMTTLAEGQRYELAAIRRGRERSFALQYSARSNPRRFTLARSAVPPPPATATWLQSQVR
jgi:predicted metalloprotease with PDZ domain